MEKVEVLGQLSEKEIDALKAKHGDVYEFEVDGKVCYLKKPDRKILGASMQMSKDNPMKFNEVILNNCWLGGYDGFKDVNGELFMDIEPEFTELLKRRAVTVKKH